MTDDLSDTVRDRTVDFEQGIRMGVEGRYDFSTPIVNKADKPNVTRRRADSGMSTMHSPRNTSLGSETRPKHDQYKAELAQSI